EVLPELRHSRMAVGLMGLLLTGFAVGAIYMQERGGQTLIDFALGIMAFALAPLLGVFCAALFTRRGNVISVYVSLGFGALAVLMLQPYMLPEIMGFRLGWTWVWVFVSPICFILCILGKPDAFRERNPQ
ncbi:MAG TPA: sodium:solute symporter, partial [Candidatus Hydrogenedentes bacterium]|nr:sodium:solute symporter [Candidatus Hydrogenedentota bacterium]